MHTLSSVVLCCVEHVITVRGLGVQRARKPRHLNVRGNYFANRVVNLWSSLPDNVVTAPSVDSFKRRLDKHWAALPSMYDPECLA